MVSNYRAPYRRVISLRAIVRDKKGARIRFWSRIRVRFLSFREIALLSRRFFVCFGFLVRYTVPHENGAIQTNEGAEIDRRRAGRDRPGGLSCA